MRNTNKPHALTELIRQRRSHQRTSSVALVGAIARWAAIGMAIGWCASAHATEAATVKWFLIAYSVLGSSPDPGNIVTGAAYTRLGLTLEQCAQAAAVMRGLNSSLVAICAPVDVQRMIVWNPDHTNSN
jgi:hypothetical protein